MIARLLFIEDIPPQQESTFFFFLGYLRHDRQVEVESEFLFDEKLRGGGDSYIGYRRLPSLSRYRL